jgi:alpha-L-fucosidase
MTNVNSFFIIILLSVCIVNISVICQNNSEDNYVLINPDETAEQIIKKAANVTPSKRQYEWQQMEFTGFIHFGINTFDEVEWGKKEIDISKFNPAEIDVKQWVKVFKDAGMKLIILTAKHHDGFCLWPSKFTDLDISNTRFQNGKGDIVKDLSNACREAGIKFGFYLSPWDMHESSYGTPEYNTYFLNQLTELLTNYEEIAEVWFDAANGEGPNGKKQIYNWQAYYKLVRELQPNAVIAVAGPDVRWVGTETGYGRKTEWSVLPNFSMDQDEIAANSQQAELDGGFVPQNMLEEDLGSREKIMNATSLIWYPSEVDVSIRPGWFYKKGDDDLVKSPSKLLEIWFNSVGLNSVLLLNVPPDKRGLITDYDIKSLNGLRYMLDETFNNNLVRGASAEASNQTGSNSAALILDDDYETYWTTNSGVNSASIEINLDKEHSFNSASIQENILIGQRVEKFHLEWWDGNKWNILAWGTTIGYKRLIRFPEVACDRLKVVIDECRLSPTISSFGLYLTPPEVHFTPASASFDDHISVSVNCDAKNTKCYYTLDGSIPDENSNPLTGDIVLDSTTVVTVIAFSENGKKSLPVKAFFNKAKYNIKYLSMYDKKYPGQGKYSLVDGVAGSTNFNDGKWIGYQGTDLDVIVDLGEIKNIRKISSGYLSDSNSWIFLPKSVEYSLSSDGKVFKPINKIPIQFDERDRGAFVHIAEQDDINITARFIKVKANNIKVCPDWHKGAGDKAWLFTDEIKIE